MTTNDQDCASLFASASVRKTECYVFPTGKSPGYSGSCLKPNNFKECNTLTAKQALVVNSKQSLCVDQLVNVQGRQVTTESPSIQGHKVVFSLSF